MSKSEEILLKTLALGIGSLILYGTYKFTKEIDRIDKEFKKIQHQFPKRT